MRLTERQNVKKIALLCYTWDATLVYDGLFCIVLYRIV